MAMQLPNLDDRRFDDLVAEALALIPVHAPEWTNHNPSDPGITLVELFAFLTEAQLYHANRITDEMKIAYLRLINGPEWQPEQPLDLNREIRETVLALRQPNRAVTPQDFERLALQADARVARAHCVPRRKLSLENLEAVHQDRPNHVSVVIVPAREVGADEARDALLSAVEDWLEPRRLLTTRVHAVFPRFIRFGIQLRLHLHPDALESTVEHKAKLALLEFFDPLPPHGPADHGWPFGRDVFVSEIYELMDSIAGVDYVERRQSNTDASALPELHVDAEFADRLILNSQSELAALRIHADELVQLMPEDIGLDIVSPLGMQG